MATTWFYDDALADLRWKWVAAVRALNQQAAPPAHSVRRVHVAAQAYFARAEGLRDAG